MSDENNENQTQERTKKSEKPSVMAQGWGNIKREFPKIIFMGCLVALPILLAMYAMNKITGGAG